MEKVRFLNADVLQKSMIGGYVVDFEIEHIKEKSGFQKDDKEISTFRATFSGMTLRRWNHPRDLDDNEIIKLAFPFVVQWVTDRVKDKTLKEFEEGIISIDEVGPTYPFDASKIEKIIGYEIEFIDQIEPISTRIEQNVLANEIIVLRDNINVLIHSKKKDTLFKLGQERSILYLFRKVETEEQLTYAIASLANLVTDLNIQLLKKIAPNPEKEDKSLMLLEKFLYSIEPDTDELLSNLKTINKLRQAFPIHSDKADIVKTLKKFDIEYGDKDYDKIWNKLMTKYRDSLISMMTIIKKYVA